MSTTRIAAVTGTAALSAGTAAVALAAPAHADVERNGTCGGARFDFSVDRDDDRRGFYGVGVDLDDARLGTKYRVVLQDRQPWARVAADLHQSGAVGPVRR